MYTSWRPRPRTPFSAHTGLFYLPFNVYSYMFPTPPSVTPLADVSALLLSLLLQLPPPRCGGVQPYVDAIAGLTDASDAVGSSSSSSSSSMGGNHGGGSGAGARAASEAPTATADAAETKGEGVAEVPDSSMEGRPPTLAAPVLLSFSQLYEGLGAALSRRVALPLVLGLLHNSPTFLE